MVVVVFCAALASTAPAAEPLRMESTLDAMGTTFTIVAYGEDRFQLDGAVEHGFEEIRRLDDLLSNYKPASEWSRMNREAADHPVRVVPELFRLLQECERYNKLTGGAFDITVGPVVKVWGFYKGTGRLPHRAEIRGALARAGWDKVKLDPDNFSVSYTKQGVELDPGGIGKGYAVDRVVEILKKSGIASALVSGGGSSVYALGAPPNQKGWEVKIRDPRRADRYVETLTLSNLSMSTSGTSEKFFYSGGKLYSHIFDPRTGYPAEGMLSASVVAPRTIDSEAWTKPFFINGRRWAQQHKPDQFRVFLCEDRTDTPCAWLQ